MAEDEKSLSETLEEKEMIWLKDKTLPEDYSKSLIEDIQKLQMMQLNRLMKLPLLKIRKS